MLALRRVRPAVARSLARANSTAASTALAATASASDASAAPASAPTTDAPTATETRGRKKRRSTHPHRPAVSVDSPKEWSRPVAKGLLPAYDLALQVIREDARAVQAEEATLRAKLAEGAVPEDVREKEEKRADILAVMGKINLPDVRWKAANGMADMSEPVYRHLVEKKWRSDGPLDLLMERLHQMNVIPDVLPDFHPSFDMRLTAPDMNAATHRAGRWKNVEPGSFVPVISTRKQPRLYTTVFHTEPQQYTLMMVDPDVPDEDNASFTTFLHWLQPNLTLPAAQPLNLPTAHTVYVPPHPAKGTPYHRYVVLLLPQTREIKVSGDAFRSYDARLNFDVRSFVEEHELRTDGGAAHMFRAVWDEESSNIWKQVIKKEMPRYGYIPRPDPYAETRKEKKFAAMVGRLASGARAGAGKKVAQEA
ncbi:PEBP-like protein [Peniophora sp. CONT]|nr:PEBP-like protein [Peniophora sp. CONT]